MYPTGRYVEHVPRLNECSSDGHVGQRDFGVSIIKVQLALSSVGMSRWIYAKARNISRSSEEELFRTRHDGVKIAVVIEVGCTHDMRTSNEERYFRSIFRGNSLVRKACDVFI